MTASRGNRGIRVEFEPMSPEEMQRKMEFLLTQQAQFAADLQRLAARTDTLADAMIGLTGIVGRIAERQDEGFARLREHLEAHDSGFAELRDYIKTVESHLDVVIEMFERHLREDHDRPPS